MIRLFITLPFVLGLIILAACNQDPVAMQWLTLKWQSSPGVLALVTGALFYALGYVCAWIGTLGQIRRARKAEQQVRTLEAEMADQRARASVTAMNMAAPAAPAPQEPELVAKVPPAAPDAHAPGLPPAENRT